MLREIIFKKVAGIKCCEDLFSKKKLQVINVAMNNFECKQNDHKILAFWFARSNRCGYGINREFGTYPNS